LLLALLRTYMRRYRLPVAIVFVFQAVSTFASLYLPTVNAAIIDQGVIRGDTAVIVRLGVLMLAVTGVQVVCLMGAVYFGSRTATDFGCDLRGTICYGYRWRQCGRL
jgi:ATP-binding cassette, subfamily B, multidrug efflux pump